MSLKLGLLVVSRGRAALLRIKAGSCSGVPSRFWAFGELAFRRNGQKSIAQLQLVGADGRALEEVTV